MPCRRPLLARRGAQLRHEVLPREVAQQRQHLVEVGDGPALREGHEQRGHGVRVSAHRGDVQGRAAQRQRPGLDHDLRAAEHRVARQRHGVPPQLHRVGSDHARHEARPPAPAVTLDVEPQRVRPGAQRAPGVQHELRYAGHLRPADTLIDGKRLGHARAREPGYGVHFLRRADRGAVGVAHHDLHRVDPRPDRDELLEDDALLPPQRFPDVAHADRLVALHLASRAAVALERQLDVIAGDEVPAAGHERERAVAQRQPHGGERRVGRRAREEADRSHEPQSRRVGEEPHGAIHRPRFRRHHVHGLIGRHPPHHGPRFGAATCDQTHQDRQGC